MLGVDSSRPGRLPDCAVTKFQVQQAMDLINYLRPCGAVMPLQVLKFTLFSGVWVSYVARFRKCNMGNGITAQYSSIFRVQVTSFADGN